MRHFPKKTYEKHHHVVGGTGEQKAVLRIATGYVRQYILSQNGEEQTTIICGPDDIFSLVWALFGQERSRRYFETITPVTIHACSREAFLSFLKKNPDVLYVVLEQMVIRYDDLLQRLAYVSLYAKSRTKILVLLLLLAQRFAPETLVLPFPLTHRDIASFLGIARETVSIAVKKLTDEALVKQKNHRFTLSNRAKLVHDPLLKDLLEEEGQSGV